MDYEDAGSAPQIIAITPNQRYPALFLASTFARRDLMVYARIKIQSSRLELARAYRDAARISRAGMRIRRFRVS